MMHKFGKVTARQKPSLINELNRILLKGTSRVPRIFLFHSLHALQKSYILNQMIQQLVNILNFNGITNLNITNNFVANISDLLY